ncbi:MAG: VOC family protein [Mycobacteriales bacterium]
MDHVQLAMPAGEEPEARAFYEGLLGIPWVAKPAHLAKRGGCWFETDTVKLHLGVEEEFRPARKAHPALVVADLAALIARLAAAGVAIRTDEPLEGYDRVYVDDPFGNRLELMEPTDPRPVKAILQVAIDCTNPGRMVGFWAPALGYQIELPPKGFTSWNDYYRSVGVPADQLDLDGTGSDSLVDPTGRGPRIWFQAVPEVKSEKNRLHFDLGVSGGRGVPLATRKALVDAEVDRLEALGATRVGVVPAEGVDHYGVAMRDPEGNEFDVH